jgi:hypothetical protein
MIHTTVTHSKTRAHIGPAIARIIIGSRGSFTFHRVESDETTMIPAYRVPEKRRQQ